MACYYFIMHFINKYVINLPRSPSLCYKPRSLNNFYHAPSRGGSTQCCHLPVRQWLMFSFLIGERKSMAYARHAHWGVLNRSNGRSRFSIYVICSRISSSQMIVLISFDTDNMPTYDFPVNTLQFILFEWYLPLDSRLKAAFTLVLF